MNRHRHERNSWLICGGWAEWCYQCGAYRPLKPISSATNGVMAAGKWRRPTGLGDPNPAMKEAP